MDSLINVFLFLVAMLVDVHAHLDYKSFDRDLKAVLERAEAAGVKAIISNGLNPESNRKTLELAKEFKMIKPALGLYPSDAVMMTDEQIDEELGFISKQKIVAIGEVGLDFYKVPNHERQEEVFIKMIGLAKKLNLPLIVHSRGAEERVFEILQQEKAKKVVVHCFSGSLELAKKIEKAGYYFSIPPIIAFSKSFQELAKEISVTKLLSETDSPFLSNVRGERNEPKNVSVVVKKISEIKKMDATEVENNFFMNFQRIF